MTGAEIRAGPPDLGGGAAPLAAPPGSGSPSMSSPSMSSSTENMDLAAALGSRGAGFAEELLPGHILAGGGGGGGRAWLPCSMTPPRTNFLGSEPLSKVSTHCCISAFAASSSALRFAALASWCFWKGVFFVVPRLNDANLSDVIERTAPGLIAPASRP